MIEPVAEALGNTPAISRKSYVHPALLEAVKDDPRDPLERHGPAARAQAAVERRSRRCSNSFAGQTRQRDGRDGAQSAAQEKRAAA